MQRRENRPSATALRRRLERADTAPYGVPLADGSERFSLDEDWAPEPSPPVPIPALVRRETASRILRRLATERGW